LPFSAFTAYTTQVLLGFDKEGTLRRKEDGFTLIELMVVVLILAILIAIGVPGFLAARKRAQDRAAQANLRTAVAAEKVYFADATTSYTDSNPAMKAIETSIEWGNQNAKEAGVVIEEVSPDLQGVVLRSKSATGTTFCLADAAAEGALNYAPYTIAGVGAFFAKKSDTSDNCEGLVWEPSSSGWLN
jgi:type IV pilus assembly protein PilA